MWVRKYFLYTAACLYGFFGVAFFFSSVPFASLYGVALEPGGALMAKLLGATLFAFAALHWSVANNPLDRTLYFLCVAGAFLNLVVMALVADATIVRVVTAWWMAILSVLIHAYLIVGFAYHAGTFVRSPNDIK